MLMEISCNEFISNGMIRDKIVFNNGLNIVVGDSNKSNSIGKSTFLMIIDFCFGGNDYITKGKDISANIGPHEIRFAFKFDEVIYYFSRSTKNNKLVNVCDKKYKVQNIQKIEEFTAFLKEKYQLKIDLSFRDTISKYFRIYGRDVNKESKPLSVGPEAEEKSIKRLLKLYGYHFTNLENKAYNEKEKIDTFKKLVKTGVQEKVGVRDYKKNQKIINQKQEEISEITENFIGTYEAEIIADLKSEISQLKRQKSKIHTEKIVTIENKLPLIFNEDEIQKFFPNIEIMKIYEIENFHKNITKILKNEIDEEIQKKELIIEEIDNQIQEIEKELVKYSSFKDISRKQLAFIKETQQLVDDLERRNQIYSQEKELQESSFTARTELNDELEKYINNVSDKINIGLQEYNRIIFHNQKRISPKLNFRQNTKGKKQWLYDFKTENDTGTGTAFKSLILLDLVILKQTVLPAIAHDSFLFTDIENSTVSEILKLYTRFEKQIFVSLTDKLTYHDAIDIIEKHQVLYLSPSGNELFGKSWKTE